MVQYSFMHLQNIEYVSTGENFNFALETESLYFIFLGGPGIPWKSRTSKNYFGHNSSARTSYRTNDIFISSNF